jgi:hypothetical protein
MPTLPVTRSACASRARACRSHSPTSGPRPFGISGSGLTISGSRLTISGSG